MVLVCPVLIFVFKSVTQLLNWLRYGRKEGDPSVYLSIYPVELHYQATYCGGERDQSGERRIGLDGPEGRGGRLRIKRGKGECEWGI